MDVPAGVTQEEGHTGFLVHLLSAVRALIFLVRRIQPLLSLVDREGRILCTNDLIVLHPLGTFIRINRFNSTNSIHSIDSIHSINSIHSGLVGGNPTMNTPRLRRGGG